MKRTLEGLFARTLDRIALERVIPDKVRCHKGVFCVGDDALEIDRYRRLWCVAFGKAGFQMAEILTELLAPRRIEGVVSGTAPGKRPLPGFRSFYGGHPFPNDNSFRAAQATLELLGEVGPDDLVFFLLSGGGSAICEKPLFPEIGLDDCRSFYELLVTCGANVIDINFVRKHFSAIKGGRLAEKVFPATSVTLYVSDAPPGHPSNVASGPTMPDESTAEDCYAIVERLGILPRLPESVRRRIEARALPETPKPGDPIFRTSLWHEMLSVENAVETLREEAARLGCVTVIDRNVTDDTPLDDAVAHLLSRLEALRSAHPTETVAVVAGGELSCPVTGGGIGGRNQAFVLGAVPRIAGQDVAVLSAGTDGIDGISPAAGAVADGLSLERARECGLDVSDYARRSDSYSFFSRLGDDISIGPTGNNVRDLRILVAWPESSRTSYQGIES